MCVEVDVEHATTALRGGMPVSSRLRNAPSPNAEAGPSCVDEVGAGTSDVFETETETDSAGLFKGVKRQYSDSEASDSSSRKQKRGDPAKFTWRRCKRALPASNTPATKTLALKANHLRDPKGAKNDLVSQLDCPNFPDNLWLDVLANRFIDLD
jgi:hypothetical protein